MNLISFGVFGIIFLMILGVVSNSSPQSQKNIQDKMYLINCPMPIFSGLASNVTFTNYFAVNYTVTYYSGNNGTGTFFECQLDFLSSNHPTLSIIPKSYGETAFGFIPTGWLSYVADFLTIGFQRIEAFFELISFFVTPTNFNILGYTIDDISGYGLMLVILVYALCYIGVGAMVYKLVSPFSGG